MINKDLFVPLEREILQVQKKEETLGYWQDAWIRLKKNKISNIQITLDGDREHHDQTRK